MLSNEQTLLRLVVAAVLGALVGLERERGERAAGLRTHALVGLGACLFAIVSAFGFNDVRTLSGISWDPSRVAAQVASGVGFLGAGAIILRREVVRGLTTAASIWAVAAVGLATGGGLYLAAFVGTALILVLLAWVKPIERRYFVRQRTRSLILTVSSEPGALAAIRAVLDKSSVRVDRLLIHPSHGDGRDKIDLIMSGVESGSLTDLMERLRAVPEVQEISAGSEVAGRWA